METSRPIEERGAVYKGVYRFYGCWTNLLLQVLNCLPDGSRSPLLPGVKTSGEEKKLQTDFLSVPHSWSSTNRLDVQEVLGIKTSPQNS